MDFSAKVKQAQPLERPHNRHVNFKGANCQPLRGFNCQPIRGELGKDVFMSSKTKADTNLSFDSKLKNAVKKIASNFAF